MSNSKSVIASVIAALFVSTGLSFAIPADASPSGSDILVYTGYQSKSAVSVQRYIDKLSDILSVESNDAASDNKKFNNPVVVQLRQSKNIAQLVKAKTGSTPNAKQLKSLLAIKQVLLFQANQLQYNQLSPLANQLLDVFHLVDVD